MKKIIALAAGILIGFMISQDAYAAERYEATAYCVSGITATGTETTEGRTLGVNPKKIPYGSVVAIYVDENGVPGEFLGYFKAEDTGKAEMKRDVIDIYMEDYEECIKFGRKNVLVYVYEAEG